MRVYSQASSTKAAWMVGVWLITIASQHRMRKELMSQTINLNVALTQLSPSRQCVSISAMTLCLLFTLAPPFGLCWFSKVEDSPGYCLPLYQGVDTYQSFHVSDNPSCIFLDRLLLVPSTAVCSTPAYFKMPKVHSRMSCRRGSSRGHVSRQPSSTTSYPSSEASNFCFDRYPVTRSSRDKGRGQFITEERSHHSNSHTARFCFPAL